MLKGRRMGIGSWVKGLFGGKKQVADAPAGSFVPNPDALNESLSGAVGDDPTETAGPQRDLEPDIHNPDQWSQFVSKDGKVQGLKFPRSDDKISAITKELSAAGVEYSVRQIPFGSRNYYYCVFEDNLDKLQHVWNRSVDASEDFFVKNQKSAVTYKPAQTWDENDFRDPRNWKITINSKTREGRLRFSTSDESVQDQLTSELAKQGIPCLYGVGKDQKEVWVAGLANIGLLKRKFLKMQPQKDVLSKQPISLKPISFFQRTNLRDMDQMAKIYPELAVKKPEVDWKELEPALKRLYSRDNWEDRKYSFDGRKTWHDAKLLNVNDLNDKVSYALVYELYQHGIYCEYESKKGNTMIRVVEQQEKLDTMWNHSDSKTANGWDDEETDTSTLPPLPKQYDINDKNAALNALHDPFSWFSCTVTHRDGTKEEALRVNVSWASESLQEVLLTSLTEQEGVKCRTLRGQDGQPYIVGNLAAVRSMCNKYYPPSLSEETTSAAGKKKELARLQKMCERISQLPTLSEAQQAELIAEHEKRMQLLMPSDNTSVDNTPATTDNTPTIRIGVQRQFVDRK